LDIQAQNFAGLAFGDDFERAAADFAVGGEALGGNSGVDHDAEGLAAERALHRFGDLHVVEDIRFGRLIEGIATTIQGMICEKEE
jgi:hypothetical protein